MPNPTEYLERHGRALAASLALYVACLVLRRPELARRVYTATYAAAAGLLQRDRLPSPPGSACKGARLVPSVLRQTLAFGKSGSVCGAY